MQVWREGVGLGRVLLELVTTQIGVCVCWSLLLVSFETVCFWILGRMERGGGSGFVGALGITSIYLFGCRGICCEGRGGWVSRWMRVRFTHRELRSLEIRGLKEGG